MLWILAFAFILPTVESQADPQWYPDWDDKRILKKGMTAHWELMPERCDNPSCTWRPWLPYDPIRVTIDGVGIVVGRSMWVHERDRWWERRYINLFLGIPYARPPVKENINLRFRKPEDVFFQWGINDEWDASFFRPACPQPFADLDSKYFLPRNTSEDCLYMNIFQPNFSDWTNIGRTKKFPIIIFVHGEEFIRGDSMQQPAHMLAKKGVMVITFNYRLGALGFLTTEDENAEGNYGIWDVLKLIDFVRKHIRFFNGDENNINLVGSGSGAAIISLLMLSPQSLLQTGAPKFHKAIMMSGSDACEWSVMRQYWMNSPREYTRQLGKLVGCDPDFSLPLERLVECLRNKHYDEIVNGTSYIGRKYGRLWGPFGPRVDGPGGILPDFPEKLREQGKVLDIPIIMGMNFDEGALQVESILRNFPKVDIRDGLDMFTFRDFLYDFGRRRNTRNLEELVRALEFEYTYWPNPNNRTAVRQNLIDFWSDFINGYCMDAVLKDHARKYPNTPVYMYVFNYKTEFDIKPEWMGVPFGRDVEYLMGYPYMNESLGNLTNLLPDQADWTWLDKNISNFMMEMWVNFTIYTQPIVYITRNTTWYPFAANNLSYLMIEEHSWMGINFRQKHYSFWREYFPSLQTRYPITTTPQPTVRALVQYRAATFGLSAFALIILIVIIGMCITLRQRMKRDTY